MAAVQTLQRKYATNTSADVYIPITKRAVQDFAVAADWTPAAGDVTVVKDGAAAANITTLPVAVTMGTAAVWKFVFSAAELTAKTVVVTVSKRTSVEDQMFVIETFGNASALHPFDLDTASQVVASVTGAVGSVTGAVGSVTGNVGGNVVGSTASVTGSVGSVTGAVGSVAANGITSTSLAANAINAASIATDAITSAGFAASAATKITTSVWAQTMTELAAVPAVTGSTLAALQWVFLLARNKLTQTATTSTLRNNADAATIGAATVSDDGTTFTRGRWT